MNNKKLLTLKKHAKLLNMATLLITTFIYLGLVMFKDTFANYLIIDMPRSFFTLFLPAMLITGISMLLSYYALSAYDKFKQLKNTVQG
jgi:hypothetical protein